MIFKVLRLDPQVGEVDECRLQQCVAVRAAIETELVACVCPACNTCRDCAANPRFSLASLRNPALTMIKDSLDGACPDAFGCGEVA